ncbi:MAG: triose-phosphate isomerase [Acidiferrobacterales bacterium]|nr:triose-phosphate isomerase [Acidiferrobacterales bacterium]
MRRFLVAGNWKMHGSQEMTKALISSVAEQLNVIEQGPLAYDVLFCPPAPYLASAQKTTEGLPFSTGAQNVSCFDSGAYTGEISLAMLAEFACEYVLLGHSERRELYAENDRQIAEKFAACINNSEIKPVLCVGETLLDRQSGNTDRVVARQLDAVLDKVGIQGFDNAIIAYEPVWAIGTGETASPDQAQEMHAMIRGKLADLDGEIAEKIQILYGGSVKPGNASKLFSAADIDGGLIGGAALDAESFAGICKAAEALVS